MFPKRSPCNSCGRYRWDLSWDDTRCVHRRSLACQKSAEALFPGFYCFLGRMHSIRNKTAFNPFPAILNTNLSPFDKFVYVSGQDRKGFLHIRGIFRRGFYILHTTVCRQLFRFFPGNLTSGSQVTFMSHQQKHNPKWVHAHCCFFQPILHVFKRSSVGNVKY